MTASHRQQMLSRLVLSVKRRSNASNGRSHFAAAKVISTERARRACQGRRPLTSRPEGGLTVLTHVPLMIVLAAVVSAAGGLSARAEGEKEAVNETDLKAAGLAYHAYYEKHKRGPS